MLRDCRTTTLDRLCYSVHSHYISIQNSFVRRMMLGHENHLTLEVHTIDPKEIWQKSVIRNQVFYY